ncbi:MAG TPA: response regulator transcription factor [Clostridiaceae bacterium]
MANEKVLIIEDDRDIRNILKDYLISEEFLVNVCDNGGNAIAIFNSFNPDIIVLDIMLSAKSGDIDKILSIGVGADDYITKPFSPMEIITRIKAHLRRYKTFSIPQKDISGRKEFGQLAVDSKSYKVTYMDKEIHLTSREFGIVD